MLALVDEDDLLGLDFLSVSAVGFLSIRVAGVLVVLDSLEDLRVSGVVGERSEPC